MKRFSKVLLGALLTLTILAFVGQVALAGPGCGMSKSKDKSAGCAKTCGAKAAAGCAKTAGATTTTAVAAKAGTEFNKEECIAKCVAQGMSRDEAESCVAKMTAGHAGKGCSPEECITKCMAQGMSREEAEACVAKMTKAHASGEFHPAMAQGCMVGDKKSYTKEECITKFMADGNTKEQAEAHYAACMVDGKCSGKCGGGKTTSSVPEGGAK